MPLNIEVKGDPASIRETSRWLHSKSGSVDDCGAQVNGARTHSEGGWTGSAGDGFRGVMSKVGTKVGELAGDFGGTSGALNRHADDLDTVTSRMAHARGIASKAGLTTTEVAIAEPGPAPAEPTPLPTNRPPTPTEKQAHSAATELASAYAAKVRAYHQAADVVMRARKAETQSLNHLLKFLKGEAEKAPFTITDFTTGLAGYHAARTSKYRQAAAKYANKAQRALRIVNNPRHAGTGPASATWRRAAILHAENQVDAAESARKATATRLARGVDRLPGWAKTGLDLKVGNLLDKTGSRVLSNAPRVLRGIPVVGAGIAIGGIGYDIHQGKDPGKAVASGVSSFATGAMVGFAVGGPVGLVAGAVIGAGIGYAVDEWGYDAVKDAAGDAAGWVGDKAGDIANGIGGFFH